MDHQLQLLAHTYCIPPSTFEHYASSYSDSHSESPSPSNNIRTLQQLVATPSRFKSFCSSAPTLTTPYDPRRYPYVRAEYQLVPPPTSEPQGLITSAALVPGGRWLITGHTDGELKLWELPCVAMNYGGVDDYHREIATSGNGSEGGSGSGVSLVHSVNVTAPIGQKTAKVNVVLVQATADGDGVVVLSDVSMSDNGGFASTSLSLSITTFPLTTSSSSSNLSSSSSSSSTDSSPRLHARQAETYHWSSFPRNDTIALEGHLVASESDRKTRIWNWMENTFAAYRWDIWIGRQGFLDGVDHGDLIGTRVDICIRPPYIYLLHNTLQIFAAFRIPEMSPTDPISLMSGGSGGPTINMNMLDENVIPLLQPEIIVPLSPTSVSIPLVQFLNPWEPLSLTSPPSTNSDDEMTEWKISFYILTAPSTAAVAPAATTTASTPTLSRYVVPCPFLPSLSSFQSNPNSTHNRHFRPTPTPQRPFLTHIIPLPSSISYDIISPTLISHSLDEGCFWTSSHGIMYTPPPPPSSSSMEEESSRIVIPDRIQGINRHRVNLDVISGRCVVVGERGLVVRDY